MVILRKNVAGLTELGLGRFITRAARAAGVRGSVDVLVTTNRELRTLNLRFRGKDRPTDVLSFPPLSGPTVESAGDVAISGSIAAENGKRFGHSAAEEVKVLVLHGLLHLAGYDHGHDGGTMARKELRLRQALGLKAGLIERNGHSPAQNSRAGNRKAGKEEARAAVHILKSGTSRRAR